MFYKKNNIKNYNFVVFFKEKNEEFDETSKTNVRLMLSDTCVRCKLHCTQ